MADPPRHLVQQDAMRSSADHQQVGQTMEAILARISAEATANAAQKRCDHCRKPRRIGCNKAIMDGSPCPNIVP
jgi:hypothetical protein